MTTNYQNHVTIPFHRQIHPSSSMLQVSRVTEVRLGVTSMRIRTEIIMGVIARQDVLREGVLCMRLGSSL